MKVHPDTDLSRICRGMADVSITPRPSRVNKDHLNSTRVSSKIHSLRGRNVFGGAHAGFGMVDIDRKIMLSPRDIAKFNISPGQYRTAVRRSPRLSAARVGVLLAESALGGGKTYQSTYNFDSPLRDKTNILGRQEYPAGGVSGRRKGLRRTGRIGDLRRGVDGSLTTSGAGGGAAVEGCSSCKTGNVVDAVISAVASNSSEI